MRNERRFFAVRVHVIVGHLSTSAETLMEQVNQVSNIPDSSARLTSVAPREEHFESLEVSEIRPLNDRGFAGLQVWKEG